MGKESGMGNAEWGTSNIQHPTSNAQHRTTINQSERRRSGTAVPSRQAELSAGNPIIIKELQFILAASD